MDAFKRGGWWTVVVRPDEDGETLGRVMRRRFGLTGRLYQRIVHARAFRLNGRVSHTAARVRAGDRISVRIAPPESYGVTPEPIPIRVVYEDAHYFAVDKPPGMLVHPIGRDGEPGSGGTLAAAVAGWLQARGIRTRIRPVNRLDRETSGLVLFARHALAHARLDAPLRRGMIDRRYLAVVHGVPDPPEGEIDAPIARDPAHSERRIVAPDGQPARTRYRTLAVYAGAALLDVALMTGRTHQIRVHLSHLGHPLFGDRTYGGREHPAAPLGRQALHAYRLAFHHPFEDRPVTIEAPLPPDLERLLQALANHGSGAV
ncbi:MAG: RluA family pseudouridine synthase [Hydrogenibacillus schlegelii]|nr:RluA family pseudouridine synthase [Hydrogenibacillus schlegelii]